MSRDGPSPLLLNQLIYLTRCLALEHFEQEILASHDAISSQNLLNGLARQLWMIVFLAQMAKPYMSEVLSGILSKCLSTGIIAEMTIRSENAFLQILRIIALLQHLYAMIGLYHQIVGSTYEVVHFLSDMSHIRDQAETHIATFHLITHIVGAIMRNAKRCDAELAQRKRHTLLNDTHMVGGNLLADTIVAFYATVDFTGSIYRQMIVVAQASHRLHMVGMVVSNENMMYVFKA